MYIQCEALFFILVLQPLLLADTPDKIKPLYEGIGKNLAEVKKASTAATSATIGSVLDDVDRLYNATRVSQEQDHASMKELETKTIENVVLQKELLAAKQETELLKQTLQDTQTKVARLSNEVDAERAQKVHLKKQNTQLLQKVSQKNDMLSDEEMSHLNQQLSSGDAVNGTPSGAGKKK